ncbi:MAG: hypothetical protein AUI14_24390 [Actinobacteria bacterium 13_2_20CM_2_71_6]|nr:MAG: hypothetical protein AUI14_24390 [Actinobacteria bacterium 13_2_20CM_2_71_6]
MSGLGRVVAFNWPRYAAGLLATGLGALVPLPRPARFPARAGALLAAGWIASSLAATWWVYDRSGLYTWRWLTDLLPTEPRAYAVVSTGLDEISPTLATRYPHATATVLDLYHPAIMREGSIRRARALVPPPPGTRPAHLTDLPVPTGSLDAVFVVFAAHELREAGQRAALFGELARILRPGGRLLLVEHCRDLPNVAAFGPGAWHFYPRREWHRVATGAGLAPAGGATLTPLVRAMVYQR